MSVSLDEDILSILIITYFFSLFFVCFLMIVDILTLEGKFLSKVTELHVRDNMGTSQQSSEGREEVNGSRTSLLQFSWR